MGKKRSYTDEFKREAVKLVTDQGYTAGWHWQSTNVIHRFSFSGATAGLPSSANSMW